MSSPSYDSTLRPYLQLPALLSLTWLAYPILSLIFIAFRLQLSLSSAETSIASAKENLVASCKAAESAATSAASMPRFLAVGTNEQFADAVNGSLNAARATLVLALTMMEGIINFIIDIYRSTFLCFVELVVRGGLSIIIGIVKEFTDFVESFTGSLRTNIQGDIATANSAIQSVVSAFNKINPFSDVTVPQFAIPSLSALDNVTLPTGFQDALIKLNSSIPSVDELKGAFESIIDTPFELLKKDINDTFAGITFDAAVLPLPQANRLSFCGDMDLSVVDDLGHDLVKIAKIGTIILVLLALVLTGANCALEWYKWRCLKTHMEYTRQAWTSDPTLKKSEKAIGAPSVSLSDHNLMMLAANSQHPLLTRIANNVTARFRLSPMTHTHLQWFLHYVFHTPALACFLIGFFGILSVQIQLIAIGPLAERYSARVAASTADFSTTIATSINDSMFNQSTVYATDVNGRVDLIQNTINEGVFGWVNVTTTTLNSTINDFYTKIQNAVDLVFNGTVLDAPAQDFVKCIIGSKVDAIENALTFLHDNLVVNMPRVNQTVLMLSPAHVNEMTAPIAAAAVGDQGSDDGGLIGRIVLAYAASLKKERLMFAIFLGLWGLVVLMGLSAILWNVFGRRHVETYKRRKWQKQQKSGINGFVVPFRSYSEDREAQRDEYLPNLTPMPSPRPAPATTAYSTGEALNEKSSHGWDNLFFAKKGKAAITTSNIGKPTQVRSLGSAWLSKENSSDEERPSSRWMNRMTDLWKKDRAQQNDTESGHYLNETSSTKQRPNLRISITSASIPDGPRSAWSASPTRETTNLPPWANLMVPTKKARVPSDVSANYEPSNSNMSSNPFAPPIHHGFEHHVRSATPPPALSPRWVEGTPLHLVAPGTHRRTSSVPSPNSDAQGFITNSFLHSAATSPAPSFATSTAPVTRLLTTNHARQSSSVINPFSTPFDDEHRVQISHPSRLRKSTQTNPFANGQAF